MSKDRQMQHADSRATQLGKGDDNNSDDKDDLEAAQELDKVIKVGIAHQLSSIIRLSFGP